MNAYRIIYSTGEETYIRGKKPDVFEACFGADSDPVEIARFDTKEKAYEALKNYDAPAAWLTGTMTGKVWSCSAYALEISQEDDDGEFIYGSDYDYLDPIITGMENEEDLEDSAR